MNGQVPCSAVLDDATATTLRGSAVDDAMCDWLDGSTLIAFLTRDTAASRGMSVGIRSNVLWPASVSKANCNQAASKCATAQSLSVNADFPCDTAATSEVELCVVPTALIQAPAQIDSCPGTGLELDASRSSGGGVRSL